VDNHAQMRALVVTNMWPSPENPALGSFVRDQVEALRALDGIDVDVFSFPPRGYLRAAMELRRRYRHQRFDVVHAHFGLSAWPALAVRGAHHAVTLHGTDVRHPRSRRITQAVLGRMDLVAAVSEDLAAAVPGAGARRRVLVLPCGVAVERFRPLPRTEARARLGLDPDAPCVLFPADPARPGKRHDLARATAGEAPLLTLGSVAPDDVPLYVNAANAVLVPSDAEGFGLAVLEALACDVPVLATPVGIHARALDGIDGTLCAPWDRERWRAALEPHLADPDPRIAGRARAAEFSSAAMARRVAAAWADLTGAPLYSPAGAPEGAPFT
jgi:glycosyltransferase involved in cell wall biosynthesis